VPESLSNAKEKTKAVWPCFAFSKEKPLSLTLLSLIGSPKFSTEILGAELLPSGWPRGSESADGSELMTSMVHPLHNSGETRRENEGACPDG
jgi:hypothetical protein